jgi:glycosyltransferase involved in cell wall biosynthesis
MTATVKKVLIAHQSTIPHYRVPFYEAVERLRPKWWEFSVIYDTAKAQGKSYLAFDPYSVNFYIKESRTYSLQLAGKQLTFQIFPFEASKYDLLIMGSGLNNISYPISYLWHCRGKCIAFWGHGRDSSVEKPEGFKALSESMKVWLTRRADGFFAYTNGVRDYMVNNGVDRNKIFVLHNTIDIVKQRALFERLIPQREMLRSQAGLSGKKVLLFVGRLTRQKQLDVLVSAFSSLRKANESYHLILIGGGDTSVLRRLTDQCGKRSFSYLGPTEDISQSCIVADLYVLPGAIGLGPLHALCFDLTPAVIHSPVHKPEYEYLTDKNALILPDRSTPEHYAGAINSLLEDRRRWAQLRAHAWPSIKHLTIEKMARNFVTGVSSILGKMNGRVNGGRLPMDE